MDALRVTKVERVVLERTSHEPPYTSSSVEGTLHLTPHHLFFSPSVANAATSSSKGVGNADGRSQLDVTDEIWVPYPIINVLHRLPQTSSGLFPLLLSTKTFHTYTFLFERNGEGGAEDVWQSVRDCAITREPHACSSADMQRLSISCMRISTRCQRLKPPRCGPRRFHSLRQARRILYHHCLHLLSNLTLPLPLRPPRRVNGREAGLPSTLVWSLRVKD